MDHSPYRAAKQTCQAASKKRQLPVTPLRSMETRAAKKARLDSLSTAATPEIPSLDASMDVPSLSLISPPNSNSLPAHSSPAKLEEQYQQSQQASPPEKHSFTFSSPLTVSSFRSAATQLSSELQHSISLSSAAHVGQTYNGTWFINSSPIDLTQDPEVEPTSWPVGPSNNPESITQAMYHDKSDDDEGPNQEAYPERSRRKKKSNDDDLSFRERSSSAEQMEQTRQILQKRPVSKRRSTNAATTKIKTVRLPLYHENVQEGKPEPIGQPEVWAFKRQQLCETLPYYNAYQSGAYSQDGIARCILIDKEVSVRDKFDDEIVITSVGGGRLLDEETGRMVYKKDQIFSPIANGFMRAMDLKTPVVVIAGQGNKISPSKLPHYYNVLDWFHVTDVWQEKVQGHNNVRVSVWKVRLEKINLAQRSWWDAQTAPPRNVKTRPVALTHLCSTCQQQSKVRFSLGPVCLNVACSEYFNFGVEYDDNDLDYHAAFLEERTNYLGDSPEPLKPRLLTDEDLARDSAYGYEKFCKRGIVCQQCGCCTRRIEWRQWSCENNNCDYTYHVKQHLVPLSQVIATGLQSSETADNKRRESTTKPPMEGIPVSQSIVGSYDLYNYDLPNESGGVSGSIRHFKSCQIINIQRDGPNDLFREIQGSGLALKRGIAVHKGTTQETLTNHFSQNFGAAYKYLVTQDSKGFDDAPPVVIKASKRMIWAGQHALKESHEAYQPFNECLVLGYFDGSKIGYHDDGEKTLGPTVATLSLGADAIMNFRPKKKTHIPALEGTIKPKGKGRRAADGITGKGSNNKSEYPAILSLRLEHGDIVIMHGREIQKLFEHEVIPQGGLRFALTCRHIDPKTLLDDEERRAAAEKGAFPLGSEKYDYDGSVHARALAIKENKGANLSNEIRAKFQIGELELSDMKVMLQNLTEYVSAISEST